MRIGISCDTQTLYQICFPSVCRWNDFFRCLLSFAEPDFFQCEISCLANVTADRTLVMSLKILQNTVDLPMMNRIKIVTVLFRLWIFQLCISDACIYTLASLAMIVNWLTKWMPSHTVNSYFFPYVLHSLCILKNKKEIHNNDTIVKFRYWLDRAQLFYAGLLFNIVWLVRLSTSTLYVCRCVHMSACTYVYAHRISPSILWAMCARWVGIGENM